MSYPYNPQRLILNALAVCQVFGDSKAFSETRLITTYLDRHVRIEAAFNDNADFIYVIVKSFHGRVSLYADVLEGFIYTDIEKPPAILAIRRSRYYDAYLPWEKRITDLFLLHQTRSILPCFSWDLASMDDNPGWSQVTRIDRGSHA